MNGDKFVYKLAWMARLREKVITWRDDPIPTLVAGDLNIIPENIDCHKPHPRSRTACASDF